MSAAAPTSDDSRAHGASLYGLYLLSIAASGVGNLIIRVGREGGWIPPAGLVTLAVLTVAPLLVAAVMFWKLLRSDLDEMLQRIVLEGMAFALVVYLPLAALYVNLRASGGWAPRLDMPDILMTPALLVAIGIAIARRRYM